MNVNDLESRMWDCYFSGKAKKLLYAKNNTPEPGDKTITGSGVRLAANIWPPIY